MRWIEKIKHWLDAIQNYDDLSKSYTDLLNRSMRDEVELNRRYEQIKELQETAKAHLKLVNDWVKDAPLNRQLLKKYPTKLISWNARSLPFSSIKCKVPVQVLITPNDPYITQDLKHWGLHGTGEDYEILIPKIYKKIKEKYYRYKFDKQVWGETEVWEFPFELREKGFIEGFDCDSWANFQVSYYRAAGLPAGKVWVVAGDTDVGGHSTVYIYSDVDGKFHHLNSTYGKMRDKVHYYPTHQDAEEGNDKIGINNVWCSYNDIVARSEFNDKKIGELIIMEVN